MEEKPVLEWDEYEIIKAYAEDHEVEFEKVKSDDIDWESEWDFLTENLSEVMEKLTTHFTSKDKWYAEVSNFGWRSQDGHKYFKASNGLELLRAILPDTQCTFRIFKEKGGRALKLQNFHHDSPMGKEWYTIRPCTQKEVEENFEW